MNKSLLLFTISLCITGNSLGMKTKNELCQYTWPNQRKLAGAKQENKYYAQYEQPLQEKIYELLLPADNDDIQKKWKQTAQKQRKKAQKCKGGRRKNKPLSKRQKKTLREQIPLKMMKHLEVDKEEYETLRTYNPEPFKKYEQFCYKKANALNNGNPGKATTFEKDLGEIFIACLEVKKQFLLEGYIGRAINLFTTLNTEE